MSLEKQVSIEQIEILANGTVFLKEVTTIMEDGKELSRNIHRTTIAPGDDYSIQPPNVQAICNLVQTSTVIEAYKTKIAEQLTKIANPVPEQI